MEPYPHHVEISQPRRAVVRTYFIPSIFTMTWARQRLGLLSRLRFRKSLESTFFVTTFVAALLTVSVSASTMLPCPANSHGSLASNMGNGVRNALSEERPNQNQSNGVDRESLPVRGLGQRAYLTKKNGWIEIDEQPSLFSWRRWTS